MHTHSKYREQVDTTNSTNTHTNIDMQKRHTINHTKCTTHNFDLSQSTSGEQRGTCRSCPHDGHGSSAGAAGSLHKAFGA